jgi:hypothetical protein
MIGQKTISVFEMDIKNWLKGCSKNLIQKSPHNNIKAFRADRFRFFLNFELAVRQHKRWAVILPLDVESYPLKKNGSRKLYNSFQSLRLARILSCGYSVPN